MSFPQKRIHKIIFLICIIALKSYCQVTMTFSQFVSTYGKSYSSSQYTTRQGLFNASVDYINNNQDRGLGVTEYIDATTDQLAYLMRSVKEVSNPRGDNFNDYKTGTARRRLQLVGATNIDWRSRAVTSVRDQGYCGSAWAFAVAAMSESSMILKQQQTYDLAEQYLLQCSESSSCSGGYVVSALQTAVYQGMALESDYPYQPTNNYNGICSNKDNFVYVSENFYQFYGLSDSQIISLLQYGPVIAGVSSEDWQYYDGGIFSCTSSSNAITHAVLLVGATDTYWLAKNSWGASWGQNGYIRISRTSSANCGVGQAIYALYESNRTYLFLSFLILILLTLAEIIY